MRTTNLVRRRGARSTALLSGCCARRQRHRRDHGRSERCRYPRCRTKRPGHAELLPGRPGPGPGAVYRGGCRPGGPQCEPAEGDHVGVYFGADANAGPWKAITGLRRSTTRWTVSWCINEARFRFKGLAPNTTYKIKDPWRTHRMPDHATGRADCRFETNGDFNTVRNGPITTFLRHVGRNGNAFIGRRRPGPPGHRLALRFQQGRDHRSSPLVEHQPFVLMGQKRDNTAMSAISRRSLELGNGRKADRVTRTVRYIEPRHRRGPTNHRPQGRREPGRLLGAGHLRVAGSRDCLPDHGDVRPEAARELHQAGIPHRQ